MTELAARRRSPRPPPLSTTLLGIAADREIDVDVARQDGHALEYASQIIV